MLHESIAGWIYRCRNTQQPTDTWSKIKRPCSAWRCFVASSNKAMVKQQVRSRMSTACVPLPSFGGCAANTCLPLPSYTHILFNMNRNTQVRCLTAPPPPLLSCPQKSHSGNTLENMHCTCMLTVGACNISQGSPLSLGELAFAISHHMMMGTFLAKVKVNWLVELVCLDYQTIKINIGLR